MEYPPNNTIYINNLNEKVKKEGKRKQTFERFILIVCTHCSICRVEEVVVRHFLTVWRDS